MAIIWGKSPFQNRLSRMACELSILKMCREVGALLCYLHTLTFADPEPSPVEAARRFRNFYAGWLWRRKKKAVWALQLGGRTRRIHYHLVTPDRYDAAEMWDVLSEYGFGRYDVRPPQPVERAFYVARYVARPGVVGPGVRTWGAVGFEKVKKKNVQTGSIEVRRVHDLPAWVVSQIRRLSLGDPNFTRIKSYIERQWNEDCPEAAEDES